MTTVNPANLFYTILGDYRDSRPNAISFICLQTSILNRRSRQNGSAYQYEFGGFENRTAGLRIPLHHQKPHV